MPNVHRGVGRDLLLPSILAGPFQNCNVNGRVDRELVQIGPAIT
jgi:hypothetical protein